MFIFLTIFTFVAAVLRPLPDCRFDVRWQPCGDWSRLGVPEGSVEVFLESNILINAQSGTEEPLSEPVKHMVVGADGALLKIVNMDELVGYGQTKGRTGTPRAIENYRARDQLRERHMITLGTAVTAPLTG